MDFNFGMIFRGTISVMCRTVGLNWMTGLKGFGAFTGFGVCSRSRWASVLGIEQAKKKGKYKGRVNGTLKGNPARV